MGTNRPKLFEVIKATRREDFDGVEIGGKEYRFGRLGNMRISDPGVANEIEKKWGSYSKGGTKEVVVAEVEKKLDVERDHTYTFRMPALAWAKYDELGRRIKGDSDATPLQETGNREGAQPERDAYEAEGQEQQ